MTTLTPMTKIARRRIKRNLRRNILLAVAVMFSMMLISFFISFEICVKLSSNSYSSLPFGKFFGGVNGGMNLTVFFLFFLNALSVRIYSRMDAEENARTLAVLTSVGAVSGQRRSLIMTEVGILYLPPTAAGIIIGVFPGLNMAKTFGVRETEPRACFTVAITAVVLIAISMLLVTLCHIIPDMHIRKRSVIGEVRRQNIKAGADRHLYRRSKTYRESSIIKRIAKESVEFYHDTYRRIALSFAASLFYPMLAIAFLRRLLFVEVVLDENPYGGEDTAAAVLDAAGNMLIFLIVCFLALTLLGILETLLLARVQTHRRRETARIYRSVGMTERSIRRMIRAELTSTLAISVVYIIFGAVIVSVCFDAVFASLLV